MSMEIKGKKVLVFGSGISGVAAGQLLLSEGAEVILYDGNASLDRAMLRAELLEGAEGLLSSPEVKDPGRFSGGGAGYPGFGGDQPRCAAGPAGGKTDA